jgi:hypothetical protein
MGVPFVQIFVQVDYEKDVGKTPVWYLTSVCGM